VLLLAFYIAYIYLYVHGYRRGRRLEEKRVIWSFERGKE
jgi:hypothetical protein